MTRRAIFVFFFCFLAIGFAHVTAAQKAQTVTGNWTVTAKMPDGNVSEQWTIQQMGANVTGTIKSASGDHPFTGTFDSDGSFMRVDFKNGAKTIKVRATLDGDTMDGSITVDVGKEYLWFAKRAK
jgi:hypothetical protein